MFYNLFKVLAVLFNISSCVFSRIKSLLCLLYLYKFQWILTGTVCNFRTYVNIFLDTEDIGQLLVNDGLAVSTGPSVPDIEIPLLLGQQFRAIVKSVNNLSDIILALECGLAIGCTMHNLETAVESFEDVLKGLLEQAVIVYVDNVLEDYR